MTLSFPREREPVNTGFGRLGAETPANFCRNAYLTQCLIHCTLWCRSL